MAIIDLFIKGRADRLAESNVNIQDRETDPIIIYFNKVTNSTTLNGATSLNDRTIIVTNPTGISVGTYLILFDPVGIRFSTFFVIGVSGSTITLDNPLDFPYPDSAIIDIAIVDMSVDGSTTEQIFGLRGTGVIPGIESTFNVSRIIFECTSDSAVSLDKFADITSLTRGLLIRSRNGRNKNILNVKTNGEIAGIMFDWNPYAATNPQQGIDGFVSRLTFSKFGTTISLPVGEDLEAWVQDNLSSITSFRIYAEGYLKG